VKLIGTGLLLLIVGAGIWLGAPEAIVDHCPLLSAGTTLSPCDVAIAEKQAELDSQFQLKDLGGLMAGVGALLSGVGAMTRRR
jgi:hypothetical protein